MRLDHGQGGEFTSEVVITPEMIEAGVASFACFDPDFGSYTEGVERVIEAVLEAGGYVITRK